MKSGLVDKLFIKYARKVYLEFYKNISNTKFDSIDNNKILELKQLASSLLEKEEITSSKLVNYVKKMKRLNTDPSKYKVNNDAEKYILFMLSVDPTFEATKIYGESNHILEAKTKMGNFFGAYDSRLIKIERNFINLFLTDNEKENINEEIKKRVFK